MLIQAISMLLCPIIEDSVIVMCQVFGDNLKIVYQLQSLRIKHLPYFLLQICKILLGCRILRVGWHKESMIQPEKWGGKNNRILYTEFTMSERYLPEATDPKNSIPELSSENSGINNHKPDDSGIELDGDLSEAMGLNRDEIALFITHVGETETGLLECEDVVNGDDDSGLDSNNANVTKLLEEIAQEPEETPVLPGDQFAEILQMHSFAKDGVMNPAHVSKLFEE